MSSRKAPSSGVDFSLDDRSPPFLTLGEHIMKTRSGTDSSYDDGSLSLTGGGESPSTSVKRKRPTRLLSRVPKFSGKKLVILLMGSIFVMIIWDAFFTEPQNRILRPDFSDKFLTWVQSNPAWGLGAILLVIAGAVVSMVPIGTPLTVGCGYIYRGVYGWRLGLFVATGISMLGSCLGAIICFLLGRYLMREQVRKWVSKYPLFDAIDIGEGKKEWHTSVNGVYMACVCASSMFSVLHNPNFRTLSITVV
jgi:hypothetical protein